MSTQKAIDVHDMHTGIHVLYIIGKQPKTTVKLFEMLQNSYDEAVDDLLLDMQTWKDIDDRVVDSFEYNIHLTGRGNSIEVNGKKYEIIGRFHFVT